MGQGPLARRLEDTQSIPLSLWPFLSLQVDQQSGRMNASLGMAEGPEGQGLWGPWIQGLLCPWARTLTGEDTSPGK